MLTIAPWTARNYAVFHRFIPLRDNFGAENYQGNSPWSNGFPWGRTVPLENHRILAEYAAMGEPAWVADRGAKAKLWIASHQMQFAKLSIKRTWMYWGRRTQVSGGGRLAGVREAYLIPSSCRWLAYWAQRLHSPGVTGSVIFAAAFVLLPLPYYAVTVQARFRHVLEPLICVLGVYLFQSATGRHAAD